MNTRQKLKLLDIFNLICGSLLFSTGIAGLFDSSIAIWFCILLIVAGSGIAFTSIVLLGKK